MSIGRMSVNPLESWTAHFYFTVSDELWKEFFCLSQGLKVRFEYK